MTAPPADPSHLFTRTGWPDELQVLLAAHPRDTWPGHPNLGQMASFWLQRHAMFRDLGTALTEATTRLVEGEMDAKGFASWFFPRAGFFLQELHTHHGIEDHHYFPVFRAADARLSRGFEVLDQDHHTIEALIHRYAEDANAFHRALTGGDPRAATDTLASTANTTLKGLLRHLDDEEDLIIPLILERTEQNLGV